MRRVLIGEFGPILRLGLQDLLEEEGCHVVAEETRDQSLPERIVASLPEVVLIDLDGPNGNALTDVISREYPAVKLIGISSTTPAMKVFIPFHLGEFYMTEVNPDQLVQAVFER